MLGRNYRLQVINGTGVAMTITAKGRAWKFDNAGARVDAMEFTHLNASSVGAGASATGSNVDNATDKNLGEHLVVTVAPAASASGVVEIYVQHSTDGGATWPSVGRRIGFVYFGASSASATVNVEAQ